MRPKGQIFDLKSFRMKHNLSQKEVAEAVKRPQSFLSVIESGKRSAPAAMLDDLVRIYNEDNITDYLHDRVEAQPYYGEIKNVSNSLINTRDANLFVNKFDRDASLDELQSVIGTEKAAVKTSEEVGSVSQFSGVDPSALVNLVNLLTASEARVKEYAEENKILRARIKELENLLRK